MVTSSPHLNVGLPASSWDKSHSTGVTSAQSRRRSSNEDNYSLKQNLKNIKSLSSHLLKDGLSRDLLVKKIGITLGDPTGISPEILVKSLKKLPKAAYIIYGSKTVVEAAKDLTEEKVELKEILFPTEARKEGFYLINMYDKHFEPGKPSVESGKASIAYLGAATNDILKKQLDAIVTLPISKKYTMEAGFQFAGHTDYLAYKAKVFDHIMMLLCKELKVALMTTHIPLKDVPSKITFTGIRLKIKLLVKELEEKFGIKNPKIAVLGLNPHAGDGGNIGTEEVNIIQPAVDSLKEEGLNIEGVLSADTAFNRRKDFDAYLAMYHDQGLIPLKLLCFKQAVNITLGLPFIRTSPDHGTGFDIAGKGIANPSSFIEAVKLAYKLIKEDRIKNPLLS
ncbi:MAG: 4-hydroxythreonine-4-phosphate dehydrogenase PdxA [Aquificota bacterium]|nr:MAG: 4-hydroxythreonine-4-phosphate dehydrogenase PdxA [Aquificota bacterium]